MKTILICLMYFLFSKGLSGQDSIKIVSLLKSESLFNEENIQSIEFHEKTFIDEKYIDVIIRYNFNEIPFSFHCGVFSDSILKVEKKDYLILKLLENNNSKYNTLNSIEKKLKSQSQLKKIKFNKKANICNLDFYDRGNNQKINGIFKLDIILLKNESDVKLISELDFDFDDFFFINELKELETKNLKLVYSLKTTSPAPNKMNIRWVYIFSIDDLVLRSVYSSCSYFRPEKKHW